MSTFTRQIKPLRQKAGLGFLYDDTGYGDGYADDVWYDDPFWFYDWWMGADYTGGGGWNFPFYDTGYTEEWLPFFWETSHGLITTGRPNDPITYDLSFAQTGSDSSNSSSGWNDLWGWLFGNQGETATGGGGTPATNPNLTPNVPGYCPQGQYHPINDPFSCVPFPPADTAQGQQARRQQQQRQAQQQAQQRAAQRQAQQQRQPTQQELDAICKQRFGPNASYDPQKRACVMAGQSAALPQCPVKTDSFNSQSGRCEPSPWTGYLMYGALALLALYAISHAGGSEQNRGKRK